MVVVVLILALVATATVVMASAILQPKVVPAIKVQPGVVKPGDIVVVTGRGWPALRDLVLVVALSPTRDLLSEGLLPVSAARIAPDGTIAATFVFPCELPWTAVREAWVVVRPPVGNLQAAARLVVARLRPTPTPTIAAAATPMPGRQQLQGTIVQFVLQQGLLILRPFDGSPNRGVATGSASVRFLDGRLATLTELKVGLPVAAAGWLDSAGTLIAEQITILEVVAPLALGVLQAPATVCPPTPAICPPTACPVVLPAVVATRVPTLVPICVPTPVACPPAQPTPCPAVPRTDLWIGEFFANPSLAGLPVAVREAEVIDFDWRWGPPVQSLPQLGYSVRWLGPWRFPRSSRYRFHLLLKGAARLSVDGQRVLDLWDCPPPAEYQGDVDLSAGAHNLLLEFRNTGPQARVQLRWEYAGAVP